MNYISFSLFGVEERYFRGALENVRVCSFLYPGWRCVFFVSDEYAPNRVEELRATGALVQIVRETPKGLAPTLWRFRAALFEDAEYLLVRDADSLPTEREVDAVRAWMESGRDFHVMRDHPHHIWHMPAGLVGFKIERTRDRLEALCSSAHGSYYGVDADLLYRFVWSSRSLSRIVHDSITPSFLGVRKFAITAKPNGFVGQVAFPARGMGQEKPAEFRHAAIKTIWARIRLSLHYRVDRFVGRAKTLS